MASPGANVTLAWDASPDTNVVAYNLYFGTASGSYTGLVPAGAATMVTVSNLVVGTTYFFAATALDAFGQESAFSTELPYTVSLPTTTNAPPTLAPLANLTINENAALQTVNLSGITSGATNEVQTLTVTAVSSKPALIPAPVVSYVSPSTTGSISFTPVPFAFGSATITVTVNDGQSSNNVVSRSFIVTVNPVNQAPTLNALANLTINENAAAQTVSLSGITSGATNENDTLTVSAVSSNPGLIPNPAVSYTSPSKTGSLSFFPAAFAFGSATITVTVNDGQASNNIVSRSFTVTVNPVNQAPTLNALANLTIDENAAAQTVNLSGITSGATNEVQTLAVTAVSSNPGLIPNPAVSYTSPNTTGTLSFAPVAFAFGSATITVTVNDGQVSSNIVSRSFTVTVNPVNQAPTLNTLANLTINENAAPQTVNLSGITSGATNENDTLTVTAVSSNPGLIPNPAVSYTSPNSTGSLSVAPVAFGFGAATVTVTVNDGKASNNIVSRSFTVTVNPVNQPPTLNPLANLALGQNPGLQTVSLAGITSGATNENDTLTVSAVSSNPGLIPNPSVSYTSPATTGSLTFTPTPGASGAATITVTVNDGQALNNTITRAFTVSVAQPNQPPTLNPIANVTVLENAGPQTVTLSGITAGANEVQPLTVVAESDNPGLVPDPPVSYTNSNSTATLTFSPFANSYGVALITVTVNDGQPTNGTVTRSFYVVVDSPPSISVISNQFTTVGTPIPPIPFVIGDAEMLAADLTLTATCSVPALVPNANLVFGGSDSNRMLTITPVPGQSGAADITVLVGDGVTASASTFHLTVVADRPSGNTAPSISSIPNQTNLAGTVVGPLAFTVQDAETPAANLVVTASSSNTGLVPLSNIYLDGTDTNRTIMLTPVSGVNGTTLITINVSDGSTNAITKFSATFKQAATVRVKKKGHGRTSQLGEVQEVLPNSTYSITAIPDPGQKFVGWTGDITSSSATLTFVVTSNVVLEAVFMGPITPAKASYVGLFYEDNLVRQNSSGAFTLSTTDRATYSGKLQIGSRRLTFTGKFDEFGQATNFISRPGAQPLKLVFSLSDDELISQVSGQLVDPAWTASLYGDRLRFNNLTNPAPWAGNYTLVLPGTHGDASLPAGHSFGGVRVRPNGLVVLTGSLADGARANQTTYLSPAGHWPLYASLYGGRGSLLSWLSFTNQPDDDLHGHISWIKPADAHARAYSAGFNYECDAVGSAYLRPASPAPLLNISNAVVAFAGGSLSADFTNQVALQPRYRVLNLSSNRLSLTFSPGAGTFRGTVVDPATGRQSSFTGALLQKLNAAFGFMLGEGQSSSVALTSE